MRGAAPRQGTAAASSRCFSVTEQPEKYMSHIPNSAMPHARPSDQTDNETGSGTSLTDRAGSLVERARNNPGKTAAAGAAVVGVIAAAAVPFLLSRGKSSNESKGGNSSKKSNSSGTKTSAKQDS
jgi:hypothetical protein